MSNLTHKKEPSETGPESEPPKPKKPSTPLEKLRESAFNKDLGEWTGLKWVPAKEGGKFVIVGSQGTLCDEHEKPIAFDAAEANQAVKELTLARPGDAPRAVPIS